MSAQLDKLEFGGESPLTMRARCGAYRHCPDPLGIVPAEVLDKLEFGEQLTHLLGYSPQRKVLIPVSLLVRICKGRDDCSKILHKGCDNTK